MILNLTKKTGFKSKDKLIEIYDSNNLPFYVKKNERPEIYFNLPKGTYITRNNLIETKPRVYKLPKLKKPNDLSKIPVKFEVVFTNNPHKCSVNLKDGIIYFDNSFRTMPKPLIDFVKFHELGHYFYRGQGNDSEKNCDLFSGSVMLAIGYNPSQIIWAQRSTLSEQKKAMDRKQHVEEKVKKSF